MVVIAKHEALLARLGLATLDEVKRYSGELVKNHRGHRDIFRIRAGNVEGRELVLYLKRNLKPYRKDGLHSLMRNGRVWSMSRQEWENSRLLEQAGLRVPNLVAYGEECGLLWEKYSFLITEAAGGRQTLEQFIEECREPRLRRRVMDALAVEIRRMHNAGLASPDLFTRHLFVDTSRESPVFCLIDMARLDRDKRLSATRRARDLAALNVTAPIRFVSARERLRFLKRYAGTVDRKLIRLIARRVGHLLQRKKFRSYSASPDSGEPSRAPAGPPR